MGHLAIWSRAVLGLSFGLQLSLFALLIRRRLAAETCVFTGLLLFYAVRTVLLYGLATHLSREVYAEFYSGLSLADLVLQIALGCELITGVLRTRRWRFAALVTALTASICITLAITMLLPPRSPVPADRGAVFTGVLFAILFGMATKVRLRGWIRALLTGLAVAGLSGAVAECGKSVAAFHRDGRAYVAWSYGNASIYVLILVYWIVAALRRGHGAEALREPGREPEMEYVRGTI